ncbi:hypothetical protein C8R44DRAFT_396565 [Mycena epipterygia]|nr:hypothetical protein C8R44DRAFT_396565 [Mycena epipterygia]
MLRVDGDEKRLKACDNAQCCKIGDAKSFGRCSGCLCFYYCSSDCQKLDWKEREHRTHCSTLRSYRLGDSQFLRVRERLYLRALLTHHYDAAKLDRIYLEQALASRPGSFYAWRAPPRILHVIRL